MKIICPDCDRGSHTEPGKASEYCQCGTRTCGCYGLQVKMGVRKDPKDDRR